MIPLDLAHQSVEAKGADTQLSSNSLKFGKLYTIQGKASEFDGNHSCIEKDMDMLYSKQQFGRMIIGLTGFML